MSCAHDKERIIEYLDGELSESRRKEVEAILASCEECRAFFEEEKRCLQILDAYDAIEPSSDFADKVLSRISTAPVTERRKTRVVPIMRLIWKPVAAAAAAIIIALSLYTFIPRNGDEKIISQLDVIQNMEMLENLDLLLEWETIQDKDFSDAEKLI